MGGYSKTPVNQARNRSVQKSYKHPKTALKRSTFAHVTKGEGRERFYTYRRKIDLYTVCWYQVLERINMVICLRTIHLSSET